MTQLPRRDSKVEVPRPAPVPTFTQSAVNGHREPAADMGTLAERIRSLMDLAAGRQITIPLVLQCGFVIYPAGSPTARRR
ncbi:hypothetical protein GCM10020295_56700 [Streptomyces cinereospinus]